MDSLQLLSPNRSSSSFGRIDPLNFRARPQKGKVESYWQNILGEGHILNCNSHCIYAQHTEKIMLNEEVAALSQCDFSIKISTGASSPLGVSKVENGINFALFSQHATSVTLCFTCSERGNVDGPHDDMIEIDLDPQQNKTRDIWHVCVEGIPDSGVFYGYRVNGPLGWKEGHRFDDKHILLDPYAKLVSGRRIFGDTKNKISKFLGTYDFKSLPFDWGSNYKLPNISEKDLVIYEMNVRAFTADESSGLDPSICGSYIGVISKINTWGYSTVNFFAPMSRYASIGGGALTACEEFKQMVKALHEAGIEIILDVVYNHTNEADDAHPYTTSFRGIDNKVYYLMDFDNGAQLLNFSGCGNTLNCNHPVVMELILDSLRHWVTEYHVGGFRFDLASVLCRGTDGSPLNVPPLAKAIAMDSVLSRCKIIAEPWDCGGLYLVGKFPNWDRWAEWNGKYRDDIRKFIKGDPGLKGAFATRLSGSADLYQVNNRKPYHSVNFVVAHDGFTLHDLVSYNSKHNDANGEGGNDGCNDNFSWNCGFEGETNDINILNLRSRQMKNFHLALMVSQGTPMIFMGDEYTHTRYGNNNSYGHDTAINHFQWGKLAEKQDDHFRFFSEMIKLRLEHSILRRDIFLTKNDITWHEDNWGNYESRFLAFTIHDDKVGEDIYVAFNAHDYVVKALVPNPPHKKHWHRVVDTNHGAPEDIIREGIPFRSDVYNVAPYSSILLKAKTLK